MFVFVQNCCISYIYVALSLYEEKNGLKILSLMPFSDWGVVEIEVDYEII